MRLIISPVGTSILTNYIRNNKLTLNVNTYANLKEDEYSDDVKNQLYDIKTSIQKDSFSWSLAEAKRASAELNGLLSFSTKFSSSEDLLFFVVTDTFQSRITFDIVRKYLREQFDIEAQQLSFKNLTTKNKHSFLEGVKELLRWADNDLKGYKESGYKIYFNLTGGFKSLLGYLTPIGMFYADSIFYIFETGELIEVPKLPIKIDEQIINDNASAFLLMSQDVFLYKNDLQAIPDTLIEEAGENKFGLSVWGELIWQQTKSNLLSKELVALPGLFFEESFKKDFINENTPQERVKLQETLAKVSGLLNENNFDTSVLKRDNGLSYENCHKQIQNKTVGHFRYSGSDRVSCIAEKNRLRLLRNGFHDVCD